MSKLRSEGRRLAVVVGFATFLGLWAPATSPAAGGAFCGCQDCHYRTVFGTTYGFCVFATDGAEHCSEDVWGDCWLSGNFCGCIEVRP